MLGHSQYRNAVASGQSRNRNDPRVLMYNADPTLPRYGTDCVQVEFR